MIDCVITVRNTEDGALAEHAVHNQAAPMTDTEARDWVRANERDPWVFESLVCKPVRWAAVWGFGSTSSEVGELGTFPARQEAEKAVADYLRRETNTAVGAWVRPAE